MSATIWSKFFWSDWESDPSLRLCSMAAQGFWMRLLCIAAKADPTGYVTVNSLPLDGQDLALMTGVSVPEAQGWLLELERNGVFSRDGRGRVYSRRMVRDAKRAALARKNGKRGGNPILRKQSGNTAWDNPPLKPGVKPQSPESRSQKEEKGSELRSSPKKKPKRHGRSPPAGQRDLFGPLPVAGPSSAPAVPARSRSATERGTRLPADWRPSDIDRAFAQRAGLAPAEIETAAERFRDHWLGRPGKDGRSADWQATWRGWIRNAAERLPAAQGSPDNSVTLHPRRHHGSRRSEAENIAEAFARRARGGAPDADEP